MKVRKKSNFLNFFRISKVYLIFNDFYSNLYYFFSNSHFIITESFYRGFRESKKVFKGATFM